MSAGRVTWPLDETVTLIRFALIAYIDPLHGSASRHFGPKPYGSGLYGGLWFRA